MDPKKYQRFVTENWGTSDRSKTEQLFIMSTGLGGETGEVLELLKKHVRNKKPLNLDDLKLELGDVLYYLTRIGIEFGISLQEIMDSNIEKLNKRKTCDSGQYK